MCRPPSVAAVVVLASLVLVACGGPTATPTRAAAQAAQATPTVPSPTATAAATATATPPATATPTAGLSPTATAGAVPGAVTAPASATPHPSWVEIARWRDQRVMSTEPFTAQGPWRVRWRLDHAGQPFALMIGEASAEPRLLTGMAGATAGTFEEPRGGTYFLMFHNTIPYEVVVEDWRAP